MQRRRHPKRPWDCAAASALYCALGIVLALALLMAPPAEAGWLSRLTHVAGEAGEAGVKAGKAGGLGALEAAAAHVAKLPPVEKGAAALAAHATPEGHWKFVNREGDVFTAANAEELAHVASALAPGLPAGGKLSLYLSEDAVFSQRAALAELPANAELHVVAGDTAMRLVRKDGGVQLFAEVRDNLKLELGEQALFREALFQLGRHLNTSNVRALALEPGGPKALGSVPRFDPVKKTALVDTIDPGALASALGKVKGQTVMITGRVEGGKLLFRPASGGEQSLVLAGIKRAAEAADVNLVVLHSAASWQPGGRNWLWQKVEVEGLDEAMKRATVADFLNALGASQSQFTVTAARDGYGRIVMQALPSGDAMIPVPQGVNDWVGDIVGHTIGRVAVHSVTAFTRDRERQDELDARIVPGIPSTLQYLYLGNIVLGLFGWEFSLPWWARLWPHERRQDYRGAIGYQSARLVRWLAYLLVFLPVAGVPAFMAAMAMQLWSLLTSPLRFVRWVRARLAG